MTKVFSKETVDEKILESNGTKKDEKSLERANESKIKEKRETTETIENKFTLGKFL